MLKNNIYIGRNVGKRLFDEDTRTKYYSNEGLRDSVYVLIDS